MTPNYVILEANFEYNVLFLRSINKNYLYMQSNIKNSFKVISIINLIFLYSFTYIKLLILIKKLLIIDQILSLQFSF